SPRAGAIRHPGGARQGPDQVSRAPRAHADRCGRGEGRRGGRGRRRRGGAAAGGALDRQLQARQRAMTTTLFHNARVMTCDPALPGLGIVERGAVAVVDGTIASVGPDRPAEGFDTPIDMHGRLLTPGLVDCHTHAIFAGDRANEFAMRAAGKGYLEIAAAGGGIQATLGPTRAARESALIESLVARLAEARALGTTTMEVKTGYD